MFWYIDRLCDLIVPKKKNNTKSCCAMEITEKKYAMALTHAQVVETLLNVFDSNKRQRTNRRSGCFAPEFAPSRDLEVIVRVARTVSGERRFLYELCHWDILNYLFFPPYYFTISPNSHSRKKNWDCFLIFCNFLFYI